MCLAVYIASDKPLPLVPWVEENPSFYVSELSKDENRIKIQFNLPHVYYVGSHEGCGCGFIKEGEVGDDLLKVENNYIELSAYIKKLKESGAILKLYSCWEGDQSAEPEFKEELNDSALTKEQFQFKEKALYHVV